MSERSLAHIEKVVAIEEIPGADKIEVATILGWKCVVQKGKFRVDDYACYIELDSIVPKIKYFDFMAERKYRVRTIKLRKQISQGLLIPLEDIGEILLDVNSPKMRTYNAVEGHDVTEVLGIIKYESPSDKEQNYIPKKKHNFFVRYMTRYQWFRSIFKMRSKSFPEWISKTDEERIQNIPWVLDKHRNELFYSTEKLDGQSATYWIKKKFLGNEFGICSRTVRKSELDGSNWSKVFRQFFIKEKLRTLRDVIGSDVAIQGEIIGRTIQGGRYHNNKHIDTLNDPFDFYVFNVYDITKKKYLNITDINTACMAVGLKVIPILENVYVLPQTVQEILKDAEGRSVIADAEREGIVIRSHDQKVSFKAISNKFLMKEVE